MLARWHHTVAAGLLIACSWSKPTITPHQKGALLDSYLISHHVHKTSLRCFELGNMVSYPARSSHQKIGTLYTTIPGYSVGFKWCSVGDKRIFSCHHTTNDTRLDGSMLSCSLPQMLMLPSDCWNCQQQLRLIRPVKLFQSTVVQFWRFFALLFFFFFELLPSY